MRLLIAILWGFATLLWLPWFALLVRLIVDVILGTPRRYSQYLNPALVPAWPVHGWLSWSIVSWWPIVALLAMLLTYIGWRFFWWERDWQRRQSNALVGLSIAVPPLALVLLYRDAKRRHREFNAQLAGEVAETLQQMKL